MIKSTKIKQTTGERIFDVFNIILLSLFGLTTVAPFVHILAASLSDKHALINMEVSFWPVKPQLDNYAMVLNNKMFWNSYKVTIILVVSATLIHMFMTVITAYPLSKSYLPGRKYFMLMVVFSMIFNAPMIPAYLVVKQLHLIDTLWALIIPGAVSSFNMILCLTYFKSIPEELFEAARIDGMPEFQILCKIALPISKPMIVTLILFYTVGTWNSYYGALMYITKQSLKPLQVFMYNLIAQSSYNGMDEVQQKELVSNITPDGLKMAAIMIASLPILLVYPFIQKFFIKGVMIGSLKE
jgi:putative aldouronate transport system permease protein